MIIGVVPAAGAGSRFAASAPGMPLKLLALVHGEAMVRRTVTSLLDGGAARCVVVVSAEGEAAVASALTGLPVSVTVNPDPSRGMFSSIQCGLQGVGEADRCVLLPGDMPYVQPETVAAVLAEAARTGKTVLASHDGRRGHPIALSASFVARILQAPAGAILSEERRHEPFVTLEVTDPGVHRDVDEFSDLRSSSD